MYRSVFWWGDSLEINPGVSLSSVFVWDVISLIESTAVGVFRCRLKIFHLCVISGYRQVNSGELTHTQARGAKVIEGWSRLNCGG